MRIFSRLRARFGVQPERRDAMEARTDNQIREVCTGAPVAASAGIAATEPRAPATARVDPKTVRPRRLNAVRDIIGANSYLEIGVYAGGTFFPVDVARKVAVDVKFRFDVNELSDPRATYFQMSSNAYFLGPGAEERFDLIYLDGMHTFEQTLIDFNASLLVSHEQSAILIDDTVPSDVYSALPNQRQAIKFRQKAGGKGRGWHGDVFKLVVYIHDFLPMLSYCTINTGGNQQTLVWREPRPSFTPVCGSLERISRLDYFWLIDNFKVLNPIPEPDAMARLEAWARQARSRDAN